MTFGVVLLNWKQVKVVTIGRFVRGFCQRCGPDSDSYKADPTCRHLTHLSSTFTNPLPQK